MTDLKQSYEVLFVGQQPETVDFTDPALPPGFDATKIHAGIAVGMKLMVDRGWNPELLLVSPDASACIELQKRLYEKAFDCVVIGGGLRIPANSLTLFEALVNAAHRAAPGAAIAFNTSPPDTAEAAARWLPRPN